MLRSLARYLTSTVFRLSLFFGLLTLAVMLVVGQPDTIKQVLIDTNAYGRFQDTLIDEGAKQARENPANLPLDDERVIQIVRSSLDQQSLRVVAESSVDGIYAWLDGDTATPQIMVDLRDNKDQLANGIADYAVERVRGLPPCESLPASSDIFAIECNPVNYDAVAVRAEIYRMLYDDDSLLPTIFTAENLPGSDESTSFASSYSEFPKYYGWAKLAPWVLLGLAVVMMVLTYLMQRPRKRAIRSIGLTFFSSGVILAVTPLLYEFILPQTGFRLPSAGDGTGFAAISSDVSDALYGELNFMLINIALQAATVGVLLFIISRFMGKGRSPYVDVPTKSGVAVAERAYGRQPHKMAADAVPIQTSDGRPIKQQSSRSVKRLNEKYRKL